MREALPARCWFPRNAMQNAQVVISRFSKEQVNDALLGKVYE